jgi:autotransporter-associated beta strand protein
MKRNLHNPFAPWSTKSMAARKSENAGPPNGFHGNQWIQSFMDCVENMMKKSLTHYAYLLIAHAKSPPPVMKYNTLGFLGRLLSLSVVTLLGSHSVQAATFTWNGGGGNVNWSTAGNWTGGAPTSNVATDLIFAGVTNVGTSGTPLNQNVANPMLFNSITFGATAGNFFLGGSGFVITGGDTATITQSSANNQSIANSITHTGGNNTTGTLALSGDGGGVVTLSGAINNGSGNRFLSITKSGTSTFTLTNTNTYSGLTSVSAGTLSVSGSINNSATINVSGGILSTTGADKLANTAAVTVSGGTLTVGGADTVASLTMSSGSIGGSNTLTAATYALSGGIVDGNLGAQ